MIIDDSIQRSINEFLVKADEERAKTHEPSGLLSASMLYQPLRFQIMKNIGVPRKPMDPYVLGKFQRGNDVEDWFAGHLGNLGFLIERQKEVNYRNVIGFADSVVDSNMMYCKKGTLPLEIKSVTNAKLKYYDKGDVDHHYKLQGCLYAMGMETPYYGIAVISAEDYRVKIYVFETAELKSEVDQIITDYDNAMELWKTEKKLPAFAPNPKVPWTSNLLYAPFTEDWINLSDEDMVKRLEELKNG